MELFLSVFTLAILAAYSFTLIYASLRGRRGIKANLWLISSIVIALLGNAAFLVSRNTVIIPDTPFNGAFLTILLLVLVLCAFGGMTIHDIVRGKSRIRIMSAWLLLNSLWLIGLIIAAVANGEFRPGTPGWIEQLFTEPDASSLIFGPGLITSGVVLLVVISTLHFRTHMPEAANRILYWLLLNSTLFIAILLMSSAITLFVMPGMLLLLGSIIGAVYGQDTPQIFDVKAALMISVRMGGALLFSTALIFLALYLTLTLEPAVTLETLGILLLTALLIAGLSLLLRPVFGIITQRLIRRDEREHGHVTREYSQIITELVDLNTLISTVTKTLNRVLGVRWSCLLLLNRTLRPQEAVELLVMQPGTSNDEKTGILSMHSPVYHTLAVKRRAVSQYDIEYAPEYHTLSSEERAFFHNLRMNAYAPIILENALIGILACGPKQSGAAFYPRDLDLLDTLAQQTGIALRNSRLFDDLQHLNKSMQSLNRTLKNANEQLEQMDAVKSDFVTIASHELRTPLAQLRGYTDIIDALNEQGMLDREQTDGLVVNLRKATERMEELISAMLDVSQLDVNAMDLRFTETSAEIVVRMAIEPLTDAIKQRKLTVSARGLSGLPAIQADLQRLVQAFRNVIVNAIKFTPDGGKIVISGSMRPSEGDGTDYVLVEIKDSGVGLRNQDLDMIFNKFYRAYDPALHSTGTYKFMGAGPGLGLTIARGVIEGHGGKIWAESTGHDMQNFPGATFYILLPVSTPDDAKRVLRFEGDTQTMSTSKTRS